MSTVHSMKPLALWATISIGLAWVLFGAPEPIVNLMGFVANVVTLICVIVTIYVVVEIVQMAQKDYVIDLTKKEPEKELTPQVKAVGRAGIGIVVILLVMLGWWWCAGSIVISILIILRRRNVTEELVTEAIAKETKAAADRHAAATTKAE